MNTTNDQEYVMLTISSKISMGIVHYSDWRMQAILETDLTKCFEHLLSCSQVNLKEFISVLSSLVQVEKEVSLKPAAIKMDYIKLSQKVEA